MPYKSSGNLPGESASKVGHIPVINSDWVKSLVSNFESQSQDDVRDINTTWEKFSSEKSCSNPLNNIWAADGSFVSVQTGSHPNKEMSFVKTALLFVDKAKLEKIDKEHPHPVLLQDVMQDSAVFHATVFPLKNISTPLGNNYDAVRNIVNDSIKVDDDGIFYDTLKWLVYKKWSINKSNSPAFNCPHCNHKIDGGFSFDEDEMACPKAGCGKKIFLTDMIGFHLDMGEDSAPESVSSAYMLVMEHLMLFTAIRLLWSHTDQSLVSETLFIKDGPLMLRSQYSKLIPGIRDFLQFAKDSGRPIHVIGQEKSGAFFDYMESVSNMLKQDTGNGDMLFSVLSHDQVRREVYRSPDLSNPYGSRTNWGEKVLVKLDETTHVVLSIPTGNYNPSGNFPVSENIIGLDRILMTLPELVSRRFQGALFPIEMANGIASMSSYPSATILRRFAENN